MIALTQEKREDLIGLCRLISKFAITDEDDSNYGPKDKLIAEIALASLTALPFGWEIAGNIFPTLEEALKPGYIGTPEPIYDEPPVSEIKFPEKLDVGEIHYELTEKYGLDVSVDQLERGLAEEVYSVAVNNFKRLNGWGE